MFKFIINNTAITDMPDGWNDISSSIKRDDITGTLLYDSATKFTFYGGQDGYSILKAAWEADPIGESTIDIFQRIPDGSYILIHSGTIFHSSIEFMLVNGSLSFKTEDRGFYAMINNNKKIETVIDSGRTKNDVVIGACPSFTLSVHKVSNGLVHYTCKAYKLIDVLKYLVSFMSDNRMTLEAPCFDVGGVYEGICIASGHELAERDGKLQPNISWDTLTSDLAKRLNVQFSISGSMNNPVMIVNDASSFFDLNISKTIASTPEDIRLSTDENKLYSVMEIGSEKYETDSNLVFPDVLPLTSFRSESFHFKGTNNIDRKLDLVAKTVVSHSAIQVAGENLSGFEGYYEDVFMISYNPATNKTSDSDWANTGKHLFNEIFNNVNIINRWAGYLPNNISNQFDNPSQYRFQAVTAGNFFGAPLYFKAGLSNPNYYRDDSAHLAGSHLFDWVPFWNDYADDGYDTSNAYGGGTAQGIPVQYPNLYYTAPVNGQYNFTALMEYQVEGYTTVGNTYRDKKIRLVLNKRDGTGTILRTQYGPLVNIVPGAYYNDYNNPTGYYTRNVFLNVSWTTYMNAGEQMDCKIEHWVENVNTYSDRHFYKLTAVDGFYSCYGVDLGGATTFPSDPRNYKSMKIEFDYPLTLKEYDELRNSKQGLVSVPFGQNKTIKGWIQSVKFQHNSGETKFTLLTDANSLNQ